MYINWYSAIRYDYFHLTLTFLSEMLEREPMLTEKCPGRLRCNGEYKCQGTTCDTVPNCVCQCTGGCKGINKLI